MAADRTFAFHRLYGDFDGNGVVNTADYIQFNKAFGNRNTDQGFKDLFDYDGNGVVNTADYIQFNKRFGVRYIY